MASDLPLIVRLPTSLLKRFRTFQRKHGKGRVDCTYAGAHFSVDLRDLVGFEIAINRFEYHNLRRFVRECRALKPDVFVDVGANIGLYTCVVGKAGVAREIVAIEPDAGVHAELVANVARNRLSNVRIVHAAAGRADGPVHFEAAPQANRGLGRISEGGAVIVDCMAIDNLLPIEGKTIAVKIDVEGFEDSVLDGAGAFFSRNRGYAQIEAHGERGDRVAEWMATHGWKRCGAYGLDHMFSR